MKRKLLLLSVLAICVATLAAGTLAYFSADGTARNVITTGNVSIAVEEWADADKTQPFEDLTGIMPGTTVTKIAEVRNKAIRPGETTAPLFTCVTFDAGMGNEYQDATATVHVAAEAVQTANNGVTALEALGWPTQG